MADVDTDPFGERESRPEEPTDTGENIPLIPGGSSTWDLVNISKYQLGNQKEVNKKHHLEE